jgi:hypothetical protein
VTAAQVTDLRGSQAELRRARFSTPPLGCGANGFPSDRDLIWQGSGA